MRISDWSSDVCSSDLGMVVRPDLFSGPIETRGRKRMSLTREQERWAEALAVHRRHGESAPLFVAERIGALALAGDVAGIRRWREIAARLDQLIGVRHAS